MERCPNCGARLTGGDGCRRCGLELASLLAAERSADRLIRTALARLAEGDADGALSALSRARSLHGDPFLDFLRGFAQAEATCQKLPAGPAGHQGPADDATAPHDGTLGPPSPPPSVDFRY